MLNIRILPCSESDLYTLQDIAINAYGDHYLHLWHDGGAWYMEKCFSDATLKSELQDDTAAFFFIYADQELVGYLKLNLSKALNGFDAKDCLELERIYLVKTATAKGIGAEVLNFTKAYAEARQNKLIWLKAMDTSQNAIDFYTQHGFRHYSTHQLDFEQMKQEYRGMVIMKLEL